MKTLSFFGILTLLVLFNSCDKEGELTIVSGDVKDFYTDEPVTRYLIGLTQQKSFSLFSPESIIDTFMSNDKGKLEYSFENATGYYNKLVYVANNTYAGFDEILLQIDKKNDVNIRVKPFNRLIISLQKTNDSYENIMIFDDTQGNMIYDSIFSSTKIVYLKSIPDEYLRLTFRLYNEKTWENYEVVDTNLFVKRIDTMEYEFVY
jgi:hypothetical protein